MGSENSRRSPLLVLHLSCLEEHTGTDARSAKDPPGSEDGGFGVGAVLAPPDSQQWRKSGRKPIQPQ